MAPPPADWSTQAFQVAIAVGFPDLAKACRQLYPQIDLMYQHHQPETLSGIRRQSAQLQANTELILLNHFEHTLPLPNRPHRWETRLLPLPWYQEYQEEMNRFQEERIKLVLNLGPAVHQALRQIQPQIEDNPEPLTAAFRDQADFQWRLQPAPAFPEYLEQAKNTFRWQLLCGLLLTTAGAAEKQCAAIYQETARLMAEHLPNTHQAQQEIKPLVKAVEKAQARRRRAMRHGRNLTLFDLNSRRYRLSRKLDQSRLRPSKK